MVKNFYGYIKKLENLCIKRYERIEKHPLQNSKSKFRKELKNIKSDLDSLLNLLTELSKDSSLNERSSEHLERKYESFQRTVSGTIDRTQFLGEIADEDLSDSARSHKIIEYLQRRMKTGEIKWGGVHRKRIKVGSKSVLLILKVLDSTVHETGADFIENFMKSLEKAVKKSNSLIKTSKAVLTFKDTDRHHYFAFYSKASTINDIYFDVSLRFLHHDKISEGEIQRMIVHEVAHAFDDRLEQLHDIQFNLIQKYNSGHLSDLTIIKVHGFLKELRSEGYADFISYYKSNSNFFDFNKDLKEVTAEIEQRLSKYSFSINAYRSGIFLGNTMYDFGHWVYTIVLSYSLGKWDEIVCSDGLRDYNIKDLRKLVNGPFRISKPKVSAIRLRWLHNLDPLKIYEIYRKALKEFSLPDYLDPINKKELDKVDSLSEELRKQMLARKGLLGKSFFGGYKHL